MQDLLEFGELLEFMENVLRSGTECQELILRETPLVHCFSQLLKTRKDIQEKILDQMFFVIKDISSYTKYSIS
jgi:hypothetical protein